MRPDGAPPEAGLSPALDGVRRRMLLRQAAYGAAAGASIALATRGIAASSGLPSGAALIASLVAGLAAVAFVMRSSRHARSRQTAARILERAEPSARNVIVTAEELDRHPERAPAWLRSRIQHQAADRAAGISPARAVPLGRAAAAAVLAGAAIALLVSWRPGRTPADLARVALDAMLPAAGAHGRILVTVSPPDYTGLQNVQHTDPARIEVLSGSRVVIDAPDGSIRLGDREIGHGTADTVVTASGYFAVDRGGASRHLIALEVHEDQTPAVRIESPGKDLLLTDGGRTIPVVIHATDDLAIHDLQLRYTKVSGSGEQFEFVEGTLPVRVSRTSAREWRGDAELDLARLSLGPGDSLVYRATARDARPGDAGRGSSDTYFVEIAGPGQVALEGVDMPPELERYAMSQQMIVVKIERLRAREPRLTRELLTEETASLAAEQRTVRANFIFLLGGHVEDEEEEAEHSHEIQEGRLENTARKEINSAISLMTRAEQGLTAVDTGAALPPARAAVEALQRAFGRSRYLLRALAVRSRLDPARRLTGDTARAESWRRTPSEADAADASGPRDVHRTILTLASRTASGTPPGADEIHAAAERALAVDPASPLWREVSQRLLALAQSAGGSTALAAELESLLARIEPGIRGTLLPPAPPAHRPTALERAFGSEVRR